MKENALVVKGLKKKFRDFTLDDVSFNMAIILALQLVGTAIGVRKHESEDENAKA